MTDDDLKPNSLNQHMELAASLYEMFEAYVIAGFSRMEALELVKCTMIAGINKDD